MSECLSVRQHAYQPSSSTGDNDDNVNRAISEVQTNAVALWFEIPSSRQADGNVMTVAAWALQGQKSLVYTSFQDSLPEFALVLAWLRQWKAPSIYWAVKTPAKTQNAQACAAVVAWMEKLTEKLASEMDVGGQGGSSSNDDDNNDDEMAAPLNTSVTFYESSLFKDSHRTIPDLLHNLVEGNSAAKYALAANVDLSSSSSSNSSGKSSTPLCSALAVLWHGLGHGMSNDETTTTTGYEIIPAAKAPFLVMDRAAASSLNIWPVAHQGQATAQGVTTDKDSLYGLLSKPCETAGGKRLLKQWLKQPLTCLETLQARQEAVAHLVTASVERDGLRSVALATLKIDLANLARKLAHYEQCTAEDGPGGDSEKTAFGSTHSALKTLYELYLVGSQKVPALVEQVGLVGEALKEGHGNDKNELWKTWCKVLPRIAAELERSIALAEAVLDLDVAPREFLVKTSFLADLADLKQELDDVHAQVDECHAEMNQVWAEAANLNADTQIVRLEFDDSTWQFRLPNTNDAQLLEHHFGDRVKVHRLLKNGVYFSTKKLRQLSEHRCSLLSNYDRLQRQVTCDALQVAATFHVVVSQLNRLVSQIDVIAALAHVAAYNNYCRPELTDCEEDGKGIELHEARHPCVELQENVEYIPNNVSLVFGESSFMILTGPNMGGKSTYIRALGASIVLAQIGSFVPASSARINLCHHLLARVGAGDLPDRGISTFMAEMIEASSILRLASRRSLIMIDELGRGTSTFDGYGLARGIAEYIVDEIGCLTVFATHFHELTALGEKPMVQNAHVTAQKGQNGLTFLYQVRPGPCLESFGIQVAEMANFPTVVVQDAKRKASELERFEYSHQTTDNADAFVDKFRSLDLPALLQSHGNDTVKRAALMQALQV